RAGPRPFRVLEAVREGLGKHRRTTKPRVVLGYRAVAVDANDSTREIAADIGVIGEGVLAAVEIGVVEPEAVGTRDEQRPVAGDDDAPLDAFGENVDVLEGP